VGAEALADLVPLCPECHATVHALDQRGDLTGIDADLTGLVDPVRAAHHRAARREAESEEWTPENLLRRRKLVEKLGRIAIELQGAEDRRAADHVLRSCRRRQERARNKLRWLERHPKLALDPLSYDRRAATPRRGAPWMKDEDGHDCP
jgi:hypothetical protein